MVKIGFLSVAHMHAGSYAAQINALPNAVISGLWHPASDRAAQTSAAWNCPNLPTVDDVLAASDAVIVCSENIHHRDLTVQAARAGKPVLCEKPLATTPDEARAMIAACHEAGVSLMTAFPCRFSPAFMQLKTAVQNGELGEILAVRATNRGRCPGGWFVDKSLSGGGAVTDHTVHVTDLLRVLLQSEVKSVYCEAGNGIMHGDYEDTGFVALDFENGVFATLDASWSRPQTFPTWGDVTLGVTGTRGVMELDMFAQETVLFDDGRGRVAYQGWGSDIDRGLVAAFVHAIETGTPPPVSGEDGLRAVEVVAAAYESIRTHQPAPVVRG